MFTWTDVIKSLPRVCARPHKISSLQWFTRDGAVAGHGHRSSGAWTACQRCEPTTPTDFILSQVQFGSFWHKEVGSMRTYPPTKPGLASRALIEIATSRHSMPLQVAWSGMKWHRVEWSGMEWHGMGWHEMACRSMLLRATPCHFIPPCCGMNYGKIAESHGD